MSTKLYLLAKYLFDPSLYPQFRWDTLISLCEDSSTVFIVTKMELPILRFLTQIARLIWMLQKSLFLTNWKNDRPVPGLTKGFEPFWNDILPPDKKIMIGTGVEVSESGQLVKWLGCKPFQGKILEIEIVC